MHQQHALWRPPGRQNSLVPGYFDLLHLIAPRSSHRKTTGVGAMDSGHCPPPRGAGPLVLRHLLLQPPPVCAVSPLSARSKPRRLGLSACFWGRRLEDLHAFYFLSQLWAAGRHVVPRGKSKCGDCASCAQPRLRLGCLNPTQSTRKKSELDSLECSLTSASIACRLNERTLLCRCPCKRARPPALSTHQISTCQKNRRCSIQSTNRKWPTYKLSFSS
jgi:hypothetical protein